MRNEVVEIDKFYPDDLVNNIIRLLKTGKIIIMPSDTIYGFLCLQNSENKLRNIKNRDKKPFLFLISDFEQLNKLDINFKKVKDILKKYWPGSVTFILEQNNGNTLGIRMPDWKLLQKIINDVGSPLISTSVNYSGMPSFYKKEEIVKEFSDKVDLIIIDKNFKQNTSSTIVDLTKNPYEIIRKGNITFEIN